MKRTIGTSFSARIRAARRRDQTKTEQNYVVPRHMLESPQLLKQSLGWGENRPVWNDPMLDGGQGCVLSAGKTVSSESV
jgi:hypothetical protein